MTASISCAGAGSGIKLGAGVTLDCNGYSILGAQAATGEGPGVTLNRNSTLTNCVIKYWDAGVFLMGGGSGNVVSTNVIEDNIGSGGGNFGDGIALLKSSNNQILNNTVRHNGPFDGIGLVLKSSNNLIQGNNIVDNNVPTRNASGIPIVNQDYGMRIEGPGAQNNQVLDNTVTGSGLEGIGVFGNQGTGMNNRFNVISGNDVRANGFNDLNRQGSGIRMFFAASNTQVTNNTVIGNGASGIEADSLSNTITGNLATGNDAAHGLQPAFDLYDTNPGCDNNTWSGNTYNTAMPPCAGAA